MSGKMRLDLLLVERGLEESRQRAQAVIMSGVVYVDGRKADKPGMAVPAAAAVEVRGDKLPYVSRGGLKLEKAMALWPIALENAVCMDVGASTGGFTDCMLQHGAGRVYAVDVGYGQLDWKLRNDERVVCMEKTNFRYMTPEDVSEPIEFASVDVSFISLDKILGPAYQLLTPDAQMVCLIKPQFEAGQDKVGKKGVVRDPQVHREVIESVFAFTRANGFEIMNLDFSPVRGPEGNIEYLMQLCKAAEGGQQTQYTALVQEVVARAHQTLDN